MINRLVNVGLLVSLACSCTAEIGGEGDELETSGELGEELRIGGEALETPTTPWTRRPTLFVKVNEAATGSDFNAQQELISDSDPDYYPSLLASAQDGSNAAEYVGAWHKDRKVTASWWDRNISNDDFDQRATDKKNEGYELFDFNVHVDSGGSPRFDAVWVKREGQQASPASRNISLSTLKTKLNEQKAAGYRPKRISKYTRDGVTQYLALWVKDGLTDYRWAYEQSRSDLLTRHEQNNEDGYTLIDISPFNNGSSIEYCGIWLKNSEVRDDEYDSSMTEEEFRQKNAEEVAQNSVLVDLNLFYDTSDNLKYSAVWNRTERRNTIESNVTFAGGATAALQAAIDTYEDDDINVGDSGRFGLFVQNLRTGSWIGYNMNEPFYMASTSKVLIAAKVIDDEVSTWDPTTLRSTDYRGEVDRGFVLADFNGSAYPLDRFLSNMLSQSDTASTDRLWGLVESNSAGSLRGYLRSNLGLHNVGEVTSICEIEKRVQLVHDACVLNVSCDTLNAYTRDGGAFYNATAAEKTCLAKLDQSPDDEEHEPYYATQANSITPVEYGHALRELTGDEMSSTERARFYQRIDEASDGGYDADEGVLYDQVGTKSGYRYKAEAQVGVMWDWDGAALDYTRVTPAYSFAVFAENYLDEGHDPEPEMRNAVAEAIRLLNGH
ncbi:MAG TPA: serine hydrolase [Polyangiaceae bacterium]|nr:serine hydrolase [Polyangiaceae bacterium]